MIAAGELKPAKVDEALDRSTNSLKKGQRGTALLVGRFAVKPRSGLDRKGGAYG